MALANRELIITTQKSQALPAPSLHLPRPVTLRPLGVTKAKDYKTEHSGGRKWWRDAKHAGLRWAPLQWLLPHRVVAAYPALRGVLAGSFLICGDYTLSTTRFEYCFKYRAAASSPRNLRSRAFAAAPWFVHPPNRLRGKLSNPGPLSGGIQRRNSWRERLGGYQRSFLLPFWLKVVWSELWSQEGRVKRVWASADRSSKPGWRRSGMVLGGGMEISRMSYPGVGPMATRCLLSFQTELWIWSFPDKELEAKHRCSLSLGWHWLEWNIHINLNWWWF